MSDLPERIWAYQTDDKNIGATRWRMIEEDTASAVLEVWND